MKIPKVPICPYCDQPSQLVNGLAIYPHRSDLAKKNFYLCKPCNSYVGCHAGTQHAMGRLADSALRGAKKKAHAAFDPIWKQHKFMKRTAAYLWLSQELGIPKNETHIGMFDIEMCKKVVQVCNDLIAEIEFELGEIADHRTNWQHWS